MAINNIPKKRAVISYENMSDELMDAFREKYPHGYADYMGDIFKVEKPDGSSFYAVSLEIPDALYLVKIKVKVDDYGDVESELFKDEDDGGDVEGAEEEGSFPASDDDIAAAEAAEQDGED
ncbi:MAG: hypothetical protein KBS58_00290 [Bacteroidales bacterium]|nr:hypothetical protein [Candidatus Cacconaster equi]